MPKAPEGDGARFEEEDRREKLVSQRVQVEQTALRGCCSGSRRRRTRPHAPRISASHERDGDGDHADDRCAAARGGSASAARSRRASRRDVKEDQRREAHVRRGRRRTSARRPRSRASASRRRAAAIEAEVAAGSFRRGISMAGFDGSSGRRAAGRAPSSVPGRG
jgi:hypothetical protein